MWILHHTKLKSLQFSKSIQNVLSVLTLHTKLINHVKLISNDHVRLSQTWYILLYS